jgi:hypothetical protein
MRSTPSAVKKWPYRRSDLPWGGQFIWSYYFEIWPDKRSDLIREYITILVVIGTDCTGSHKSNYHTFMTMTDCLIMGDYWLQESQKSTVKTTSLYPTGVSHNPSSDIYATYNKPKEVRKVNIIALSTIFQLCNGSQFYLWRKPVAGKLDYIMLNRVHLSK